MESLTSLQTNTRRRLTTISKRTSLPAEVWLLILSVGEYDRHGDFWSTYTHSTMANICRCCTLFRDLIRPRLYCNFDSVLFTSAQHPNYFSLAKFSRTLCENPSLSSMVRMVDVRGVAQVGKMYGPASVVPADDPGHPMASVLLRKAADLGMHFAYHRAYTDRRRYIPELDLVALVLVQLPMLRTLRIYWFDDPPLGHDIVLHPRIEPPVPGHMPLPRSDWPWVESSKSALIKFYLLVPSLCLGPMDEAT